MIAHPSPQKQELDICHFHTKMTLPIWHVRKGSLRAILLGGGLGLDFRIFWILMCLYRPLGSPYNFPKIPRFKIYTGLGSLPVLLSVTGRHSYTALCRPIRHRLFAPNFLVKKLMSCWILTKNNPNIKYVYNVI